jgi:hypothetical protein
MYKYVKLMAACFATSYLSQFRSCGCGGREHNSHNTASRLKWDLKILIPEIKQNTKDSILSENEPVELNLQKTGRSDNPSVFSFVL